MAAFTSAIEVAWPRVASEMALHVLAYNLTRVMNIMGIQPLMAAIRAYSQPTVQDTCRYPLGPSKRAPLEAF